MEELTNAYTSEILISDIPIGIDQTKFKVEFNKCLLNSYKVAKAHPSTEIVEGIILMKSNDGNGKIIAHAWNVQGGIHFDITHKVLLANHPEMKEVKEIRYFPAIKYVLSDFENKELIEFSSVTLGIVEDLNGKIKPKKGGETPPVKQ